MSGDVVLSSGPVRAEPLMAPQRAASRLQFGERFSAGAEIEVTPAGLLAIGAMTGLILLGSAVLVHAARR